MGLLLDQKFVTNGTESSLRVPKFYHKCPLVIVITYCYCTKLTLVGVLHERYLAGIFTEQKRSTVIQKTV